MSSIEPIKEDLFDLLPNLFIEKDDLCGLHPIAYVENTPAVAACYSFKDAENNPIFPAYIDCILKYPLKHHRIMAQILHVDNEQIPEITTFHICKKDINIPDTEVSLLEKDLLMGMFNFYNEYMTLDGCDIIDTQEKFDSVFNDASYESITRTIVMLQLEFYDGVFFPIPFKCSALMNKQYGTRKGYQYWAQALYPEHKFIETPQFFGKKIITMDDTTLMENYNKPDSMFQLFIRYDGKYLENTKATSKRYFTEYGF